VVLMTFRLVPRRGTIAAHEPRQVAV
jgi:hypothetical protein